MAKPTPVKPAPPKPVPPKPTVEVFKNAALIAALSDALSMLSDRQVDELERRHDVVVALRQKATGVGANRI